MQIAAETNYIVPFFKTVSLDLGIFFIFISVFILVGSSNAVNLTDGLDGLAILPVIIVTAALGFIAWSAGNLIASEYLYIPYIENRRATGSLWSHDWSGNWFCGSTHIQPKFLWAIWFLSMGSFIALIAIIVRHEIVFAVMAMIFIIEAMSVILQVASFRLRRKIFKMAPLHHFELIGWKEPKIIVRFWIITFIFDYLF